MSIRSYLREIGRGKDGARSLAREQAADLMGQVLDAQVSDLELGAFCIAMRVKGESVAEMLGFLDAVRSRSQLVPASQQPLVVLPSYNGARRLPLLTPLVAELLARAGARVLVHHHASEGQRLPIASVAGQLGWNESKTIANIEDGSLAIAHLGLICPGLSRLLDVRRSLGLRNSGHSLVKLFNPCAGAALVVGSYTHPEYAQVMADVFCQSQTPALLLRGPEGEPVADARRVPAMQAIADGRLWTVQDAQSGTLEAARPGEGDALPLGLDAAGTAALIRDMLEGRRTVPAPIALQVEHILRLLKTNPVNLSKHCPS